MGYSRLRKLLRGRENSLEDAAKKLQIDYNRLYSLTSKVPVVEDFTAEERQRIMKLLHTRLTEEEVFESDAVPDERYIGYGSVRRYL